MDLTDVVDLARFPLDRPGSRAWQQAVEATRADLAESGCSVLTGFVRESARARLHEEAAALRGAAHDTRETVNVYNTAPDDTLPPDHPARVTFDRGNSFVAWDKIPSTDLVNGLYTDTAFQEFLAACVDEPALHPLADPFAGLCLNVVAPGREHPWHFDTNEVAISLLVDEPEAGGAFEYCPRIRSPRHEHFDQVRAVLDGRAPDVVRRLTLRPGDLQVFHGRWSLHRVAPVEGERSRTTAIFAYSTRAGVVGTPERTRQLFGRVDAAHRADHSADDGLLV